MSSRPMRVLIVDADPVRGQALLSSIEGMADVEIAGIAHNRHTVRRQLETAQPDVLLVDLMLTGYHSIEVIRHVSGTQPQVKILALAPVDPPHDRIILAVQAGALGSVCRDAPIGVRGRHPAGLPRRAVAAAGCYL